MGNVTPKKMGAEEVRAFLSDLAANQNVAASTQNQALSALLFLYGEVLKQDLPWIENIERANGQQSFPSCSRRRKRAPSSRNYTTAI